MKASFDHLKSILQKPGLAAQTQAAYDRQRMADVETAARTRPHFLPIQHTLPAAISSLPIPGTTEPLKHDVIVYGGITDGEDRHAKFYRSVEGRAIVRYGSEQGLMLSLDALLGHSVASGGVPGVNHWPEPMLLRADKSLNLEIFQETAVADVVSTVFCAERVYKPEADEATLTKKERDQILEHIKFRPAPEPRFDVLQVAFDGDGFATAVSPKADEPRLCVGFRSTFSHALINLGFDGGNSFAKERFPIWALCSEPGNTRQIYQYLKSPLYIPPNQQLLFDLKNSIDGVAFAPDGNIEMLLRTV